MKAYVLSDRSGYVESQEVVFAKTAQEARCARSLDNVAYVDLAARRAPEFDQYAPGPVDLTTKLTLGWWTECRWCGCTLRQDNAFLVAEEDAWCSERCAASSEGQRRGAKFKRREIAIAEIEALLRWPDASLCNADFDRTQAGYRVRVRLHWRTSGSDTYANWWYGDVGLSDWEVHQLPNRTVSSRIVAP